MKPYVGLLLGALAVLTVGDVLSTNLALATVPGAVEANPVMALSMTTLGAAWWLPKAAVVGVFWRLAPAIRRRWPLALVVALYAAVVAHNLLLNV